jgi:hypothetical protein
MRSLILLSLFWSLLNSLDTSSFDTESGVRKEPEREPMLQPISRQPGVDRPFREILYNTKPCKDKVRKTFDWAKYVIYFGAIVLTWLLVVFVYFCLPVRPNIKITFMFGAFIVTIVWTVFALCAENVLYQAFFRAFRSTICHVHTT